MTVLNDEKNESDVNVQDSVYKQRHFVIGGVVSAVLVGGVLCWVKYKK